MEVKEPTPNVDIETFIEETKRRARLLFQHDEFNPLHDHEEMSKITKKIRGISQYSQFFKDATTSSNRAVIPTIWWENTNIPKVNPVNQDRIIPKKIPDETIDKVVDRLIETVPESQNIPKDDIKLVAEKAIFGGQSIKPKTDESVVPFSHGLIPRKAVVMPKPMWHPPWKLMRVIAGHTGWVRCMTVEPGNTWFATGSGDRMIKIWDMASGTLKLSLTGHISTVRGLAASPHHPYLFSCGEDKTIKCWDLEQNKAIRHYHGHLHAVYAIAQHPTIDVLVTGSRDATLRVWDIRTKVSVFTLTGHTHTVGTVATQASDPQIISGSNDSTVRLWDLKVGKSFCTLTNHKKSVRSVIIHPKLNAMCSAAPQNIKEWKLPNGDLIQTLKGHNSIINCLAMNEDDVLISGGDDGTLYFWDWKTGYNFDCKRTILQPGSLDPEAGIYALGFDLSGSRLISCEADKSIKIYKEDEKATEETHPIKIKTNIVKATGF